MQPFKAFVKHAADVSRKMDITMSDMREKAVTVAKGAEFTIVTDGECPWPPQSVLGDHVVVMGVAEYERLKSLAARAS